MKLILEAIKAQLRKIENSRTHYDNRQTKTVSFTFDGNLEGKEVVPSLDDGVPLVKVSSDPINIADVFGGTIEYYDYDNVSGEDFSGADEITELFIAEITPQLYAIDFIIFVALEDVTLDGVTFSRGVWFICNHNESDGYDFWVSKLEYSKTEGELKKLDEKYLPDSVEEIRSLANDASTKADNALSVANVVAADMSNAPKHLNYALTDTISPAIGRTMTVGETVRVGVYLTQFYKSGWTDSPPGTRAVLKFQYFDDDGVSRLAARPCILTRQGSYYFGYIWVTEGCNAPHCYEVMLEQSFSNSTYTRLT